MHKDGSFSAPFYNNIFNFVVVRRNHNGNETRTKMTTHVTATRAQPIERNISKFALQLGCAACIPSTYTRTASTFSWLLHSVHAIAASRECTKMQLHRLHRARASARLVRLIRSSPIAPYACIEPSEPKPKLPMQVQYMAVCTSCGVEESP